MRISDWSSDVCSSDLSSDQQCRFLARLDRIAAFAPGLHPSVKRGHATEAKLAQGRRRQGGNLAEFADRQDFEIRIGKGLVDPDQIGRASCRERVCQYV